MKAGGGSTQFDTSDIKVVASPRLVDTHCHVDLHPDPPAVIRRAELSRIYTIAVTNAPSVFDHLHEMVGPSEYVRVAIGLHPELAQERENELRLFEDRLGRTRYVGEVGLDYVTSSTSDRKTQRRVLTAIIDLCDRAGNKIVTVHSRRAADDVIDAFGPTFRGYWILHWFAGSTKSLQRAIASGAFVSVNPAMVRSARALALLRHVPRSRILTETDGPFVKSHGELAEPAHVAEAVEGLAAIWEVDLDDAKAILWSNFSRVLRSHLPPTR